MGLMIGTLPFEPIPVLIFFIVLHNVALGIRFSTYLTCFQSLGITVVRVIHGLDAFLLIVNAATHASLST